MGGGYEKSETEGKGGTLTVTARVSNGASRYAMPTIHELVYTALLYPDNERPENPLSDKFVEGTKADDSDNLIFSFQRPDDTNGNFTLEVFAFVKADEATTNFSRNGAPFSKAKEGLMITGDTIIVNENIVLEVNKSSEEKGTVSLQIKVSDDCLLTIDDTAKMNFTCEKESEDSTKYFITASGISVGAYPVTFTVKKNGVTVHIFTENINVLPRMCTDTWWNGSVSSEIKDVTHSMSTTLYVRGAGGWYDSTSPYNATAVADDDNLGSFLSPLATIQKAIDNVIAINDGESEYTIKIDGTLMQNIAVENMANISPDASLKLKIESLSADTKATLDANQNSRVINVASASGKLELTLTNLTITGGNCTGNGGGVYFESMDSTLTMDGCEIKGNKATESGGGICVDGADDANCSFTMEAGEISGNNAKDGGGIFIMKNGTFIMKGGTISNNTASNHAGGVGIYRGTFKMGSGTITKNTATRNGGGIYVNGNSSKSGSFIMNAGKITGNTANVDGGAVFVHANATFTMQGGTIGGNTESDKNTAKRNGGGVFVDTDSIFTMENGTIGGENTAQNGSGVYINATSSAIGTFKMSGAAKFAENDNVYLCETDSTIPTITVVDLLTAESPVVTITLPDSAYATGTQVLSLAQGSTTTLAANCEKFEVSQTGWKIDETGKLAVSLEFYVSETGADVNSGSRTKPFATIQKALDTVIDMNDGTSEYTIYIDGTLKYATGTYTGTNGMADFSALDKNLTLTIKALSGTATLDANKKSHVIYAIPTSGTLNLTLENLVITNGYHSTEQGGGIYFKSAGGTLTMNGGTISNNITSSSINGTGGGCSFLSVSKVTMNGVTITGNTAGSSGGGIYFAASGGTFIMEGGTIYGNTAVKNGGGVWFRYGSTFTMGGSASIPAGDDGKNDVYLGSGRKITIAGTLAAASPVATITPSAYEPDNQVLSVDGTNVTSLTQTVCDKFAVTPDSDGGEWKIVPKDGDSTAGVLISTTF